ncbi:MAG TPA: DUF1761 domain-containing protein [Chitinophagaceae bacterium]|nr:DUF1761 domain-containing protein [Chitinophagaceae bacterium]
MITEVFKEINWIAVLVGALGYFFLGAIWYSFLFKNQWIAYNKIVIDNNPDAKKGVGAIMFASFILMFICSAGLAILADYFNLKGWHHGLKLGVLTGVCFALTSMGINMLYEKKPLGLFFINGSYQLLGSIIASVIIVCWR